MFKILNDIMIFVQHNLQNYEFFNIFMHILLAGHKRSPRSPKKVVSIELYSSKLYVKEKNLNPKSSNKN